MNHWNGYDIEDLQPGMSATFSKTITEADIVLFFRRCLGETTTRSTPTRSSPRRHGSADGSRMDSDCQRDLGGGRQPSARTRTIIYLNQRMRFKAPSGQAIPCMRPSRSSRSTCQGAPELETVCAVGGRSIDGEGVVMTTSSARRAAAQA